MAFIIAYSVCRTSSVIPQNEDIPVCPIVLLAPPEKIVKGEPIAHAHIVHFHQELQVMIPDDIPLELIFLDPLGTPPSRCTAGLYDDIRLLWNICLQELIDIHGGKSVL